MTKMMRSGRISRLQLLLCCCMLILSFNSYCQDMLTATIANQQVHDFQRERIRSEYEQEKADLRKTSGTSISTGSFSFSNNSRLVQQVERKIIADLKKKNPVSGKALEDLLQRNHVYQNYLSLLKKQGLDAAGNYADAFTAYMLGMWRIANSATAAPTSKQIRSVRKQVLENIDISGLSDHERQEKAAYLIYDLIFANEPYQASLRAKDAKQIKADSDMVQNRFLQKNNMDLRHMIITETGFKTKR